MARNNIMRNAVYNNQVPELMKGRAYRQPHVIRRHRRPETRKVICTERKTGRKTTGIVFPGGKVYVGDDVWRLSNRADCCEYPFRGYVNLQVAAVDYEIREADTTFPEYAQKPERGYAACV